MMYVLLILDLGSGYFNEAFPDCRGSVGGKGADSLSLSVLCSALTVSQDSSPELRS